MHHLTVRTDLTLVIKCGLNILFNVSEYLVISVGKFNKHEFGFQFENKKIV